jgi:hypothetical protein
VTLDQSQVQALLDRRRLPASRQLEEPHVEVATELQLFALSVPSV